MFTFANSKFVVPIISVYIAEDRKYLEKLTLYFENDEYEPVAVTVSSTCKILYFVCVLLAY
jgi:hypothetical protein